MDSSFLFRYLTDEAGNQMVQVLAGLAEAHWDARLEGAMSPREVVVHCSECYAAGMTVLRGGTHAWGTYQAVAGGPAELLAEMKRLRTALVDALREDGTEQAQKMAVDYVALHDAYHVGQLVALRSQLDPTWNANSIYEDAG